MVMAEKTYGESAKRTTIMVIEPDLTVRSVIAQYLRECGYEIVEGVAAADAINALAAGVPIDILFSEVALPGDTDGFALAKRVLSQHNDIGIILTSGVANIATKAGDLCDQGPLTKPYHPAEVIRRINALRSGKPN